MDKRPRRMERLTSYESDCKREMICRYEDCDICEEYCPHLNEDNCPCLQEVLEKLAEYEDLEEQGKLLKQPCALGDTVYTNCSMQGWYFKKENRPYKAKVVFMGINGVDNYINIDFGNGHMLQFKFSDIGKTVFLTREAAKFALKERCSS